MSWVEQLRPASFRGVPFSMRVADGDFGRRTVTHEYPKRDKPFVEDMGRSARVLTFEAIVIGANYMAARDRLLAAIEQPGAGALVHPYLGQLTVTVTDAKLRESTEEGGLARFTIKCTESGEATFPTAAAETGSATGAAATAAVAAAQSQFTKRLSVAGKPQFVAAGAASILTRALDQVTAATAQVRAQADAVARLTSSISAVNAQIVSIVYEPASAAQALVANIKTLINSVTQDPRDALSLARVFFRFGEFFPTVPASTASRQAEAGNQAAMIQLVRAVAVAEGARVTTALTFDSYQDAIAVRDELVDVMTGLMTDGADDALYESLRALRSATVRDITQRGADLARLVAYTPRATLPALVVAHQLYADATRADELVLRNRIAHPSFVPGAQPLEVLTS